MEKLWRLLWERKVRKKKIVHKSKERRAGRRNKEGRKEGCVSETGKGRRYGRKEGRVRR